MTVSQSPAWGMAEEMARAMECESRELARRRNIEPHLWCGIVLVERNVDILNR